MGIRNATIPPFMLNLNAAYRGDGWVIYEGALTREDIESGGQLVDVNVMCFAFRPSFWDVAFEDLSIFATQLDRSPVTGAELRWFEHGRDLVEAVARDCERRDRRLGPAIRAESGPRSVVRWRGLLNNIAASMLVGLLVAGMITRVVRLARGGVVGERRRRGLCIGCGYDRVGVGKGVVCPECGRKD